MAWLPARRRSEQSLGSARKGRRGTFELRRATSRDMILCQEHRFLDAKNWEPDFLDDLGRVDLLDERTIHVGPPLSSPFSFPAPPPSPDGTSAQWHTCMRLSTVVSTLLLTSECSVWSVVTLKPIDRTTPDCGGLQIGQQKRMHRLGMEAGDERASDGVESD